MNPIIYINTILGTGLIIILVYIDYLRKFNTDNYQRMLFLIVLGSAFLAITTDYISVIIDHAGNDNGNILFVMHSLRIILQTFSYYFAFIFVDYFIHNNRTRSIRMIYVVLVFLVLYSISVLLNLRLAYYFYLGTDNDHVPGQFFAVKQILSHLPILLCIIDMLLESKHIKQVNFTLVFFFGLFTGLGAALDLLLKTTGLEWLCFTMAVLCTYFFIIRIDSKIDALTGIGNRYSFNEFIENLSRRNRKRRMFRESWAVVMLDMDHFKEINDSLGHLEGDKALRDMAKLIKSSIRHSDFAARYGGDEFVLATKAETDIEKMIARLRKALDHHNDTAGRAYKLEISYGYDIFATDGDRTIKEFLAHIDNLMYKHKAERRRISDKAEDK